MSDTNILKPCPFCGSEPISESHDENGWYIGCSDDDCNIRPNFWGDNKASAYYNWNKRIDISYEKEK